MSAPDRRRAGAEAPRRNEGPPAAESRHNGDPESSEPRHPAGPPGEDELEVGVGPYPEPWPDDPRYDPALLRDGDRRNVIDRYRYWRRAAIVADLDQRRHPFHVAVENWEHDRNIGTVVRNANAFLAAEVHIIGRRRWNRRGAMVTDRYQHVRYHPTIEEFLAWTAVHDVPIVGVDNLPGSVPIESLTLPERCVLLFGQEGPGLSESARAAAGVVASITQFGSTRSINAGVASGVAMHTWTRQHAHPHGNLSENGRENSPQP